MLGQQCCDMYVDMLWSFGRGLRIDWRFYLMSYSAPVLIFLQHACGYEYTNKLHRMFTDISISSDLNSSFIDFLSNANVSLGVGFTLFVLQVSLSWCYLSKLHFILTLYFFTNFFAILVGNIWLIECLIFVSWSFFVRCSEKEEELVTAGDWRLTGFVIRMGLGKGWGRHCLGGKA